MARGLAVDFTLLGIPELQEKFRALPLVMQRKVVRQASRAVVQRWRLSAVNWARAITNPANRTTRMLAVARTLTVRAIRRSRRFVGARLLTATRERLGIKASSPWYYPAHVHLGRRHAHLRKPGPGVSKQAIRERVARLGDAAYQVAPQPFMRGPLLAQGPAWNALFGALIREGLEREAAQPKVTVPPEAD